MSAETDARLQHLIAAFEGPIGRPRISVPYRLGLGAVAIAMLVLPVLYLIVAIAAGWAVVTLDAALINSGVTGRPLLFGLLVVTVGGGCAVVFMFKPLFAPRPAAPDPDTLRREDEPVLFGFVDHLCGVVGAPTPTSIAVACHVNASAGFRRGAMSFLGRDLTLTIGLPLVAGLTLRQFTGVLAHEFGHFAQGTGMRLSYVIRAVNLWFARVVYERDAWDAALVRRSTSGGFYVVSIAHVARGAVWLTRRVLWALMMVGHAISCFALRQMEYDADAYETRIGGSDVFESTSLRISQLGAASQVAHTQLAGTWKDRRLVNDLPALIAVRLAAFDAATLQSIRDATLNRKTGALDTHPADVDRIAAARRIDAPGVFHVEAPAAELFTRFDALCRDVTRRHYTGMIGEAVDEARLQGVDELMAGSMADGEARDALTHVFGPVLFALHATAIGALRVVTPPDRAAAVETLRQLVREMRAAAPGAERSMKRLDERDDQMVALEQQIGLAEAGAAAGRSGVSIALAGLRDRLRALSADAERDAGDFTRYMRLAGRRIELGLGLALDAATADAAGGPSSDAGALEPMLRALDALQRHGDEIRALRMHLMRFHGPILEISRDPKRNQDLVNPIRNATRVLANQLIALRGALDVTYPFEHAGGEWQLGAFLVERVPPADDVGEVFGAVQLAINRAFETYMRVLAHVCRPVRRVEGSLVEFRAPDATLPPRP